MADIKNFAVNPEQELIDQINKFSKCAARGTRTIFALLRMGRVV